MSLPPRFNSLARQIDAIVRPHPTRVAIDGIDAAGKSTFADELARALERLSRSVIRASVDDFHRPAALRRERGTLSPEGYLYDAFDYVRLENALLNPLGPGGSRLFERAVFDLRCDEDLASALEHASDDAVLVFDGVFLHRPELRKHWDFSVFLRVDFAIALERARQRDGSSFDAERYEKRYFPGQRIYLDTVEPERWASVVIDE